MCAYKPRVLLASPDIVLYRVVAGTYQGKSLAAGCALRGPGVGDSLSAAPKATSLSCSPFQRSRRGAHTCV